MTASEAQRRGRAAWLSMEPRGEPAPAEAILWRQGEGQTIVAGGMPVIVKIAPDMCDGRLMFQEQDVPPRMLVPAHRHRQAAQFCVVLDGTLCCLVGYRVYTLERGDFLWRPPGTVHAVWNPDREHTARQFEGSMPGDQMFPFFLAFEKLTLSSQLTAARLADAAAPFGTFYDEDLTRKIEQEYGVSASGGWRP
jgi:mannose-6-phosphate isomerase-like protein (cupin superfamily)